MSDTWVPSHRTRAGAGSSQPDYPDGLDLSRRVRLLTELNPYLVEQPDVLMEMAGMPVSIDELSSQAGQMFGMQSSDRLASRLVSMDDALQRQVWETLSADQKMGLEQMGYSRPKTSEENWLDRLLGPADEIASVALRPVTETVNFVGGNALKGLTWIGDRPAHLYRTIRMQDGVSQGVGLLGALAGGLAVAAAPFTGGASLTTLGLIGLGALGGASVASFATQSVVSNPMDWLRAFRDTYNGERVFERGARNRADELLGDPRLTGLAQDLALVNDEFDMAELMFEMAGQRDTSINSQLVHLEELAGQIATPGSPEFQKAYQAMLNAVQDPIFQEAVLTLQRGKISIGRDIADAFQLDQGTFAHSLVSGSVDAMFSIAVDPTLVLGKAAKWNKARKYGIRLSGAATDLADEFARVAQRADVQKYHQFFVDSFNAKNIQDIRTYTPEMQRAVLPFKDFLAAAGKEQATLDDLHDWFVGTIHLGTAAQEAASPLAKGIGTMRGMDGIVLANFRPGTRMYRTIAGNLRAFTGSLTDAVLEQKVVDAVKDSIRTGDYIGDFGDESTTLAVPGFSDLTIDGATGKIVNGWQYNQRHEVAARAGHALGAFGVGKAKPFYKLGSVIQSITTMAPAGTVVNLAGDKAIRDVVALTEMGRFMGMPSWARRAFADSIVFSDDVGARMALAHGWLDNAITITGVRATARGSRIVDEYLARAMHAYGVNDRKIINGREVRVGAFLDEQADAIVMPDLKALHRAAKANLMAEFLGIVDANIIDPVMTRIWKPAVLLRIGFIPRAAGEEMVNFMFRGGFGGLVQEFGARAVGRRQAVLDARIKKQLGLKLEQGEVELLNLGHLAHLPAHIRPLARMLDHWDWSKPVIRKMEDYGEWLDGSLRQGLPGFKALGRGEGRVEALIAGDAVPVAGGGVYSNWRLNLQQHTNDIFLGGKHSWRRMASGGVANSKIKAAVEMERAWARSIMDEVSTMSAGPYDPGHDPALEQKRMMVDRDGNLRERRTITLKGQVGIFSDDRDEWVQGVHYQAVKKIHDPIGGDLAGRFIANIAPADEGARSIAATVGAGYSSLRSPFAIGLMQQFLGKPDARMFRAWLRSMENQDPEVVRFMRNWLDAGNLDELNADDVFEGVSAFLGSIGKQATPLGREVQKVRGLVAQLEELTPEARTWAGAFIKTGNAGSLSESRRLWEQHLQFVQRDYDELLAESAQIQVVGQAEQEIQLAARRQAQRMLDQAEERRRTAKEAYDFLIEQAAAEGSDAVVLANQFRYEATAFQLATREVEAWANQIDLIEDAAIGQAEYLDLLERNQELAERYLNYVRANEPKLYSSWDEAQEDMIAAATELLFHSQNQRAAGKSMRMLGQPVKEGQTVVWLAPKVPKLAEPLTFEKLVAMSDKRNLLLNNQDTVERWLEAGLDHRTAGSIVGLADRQLVQELHRLVGYSVMRDVPPPMRAVQLGAGTLSRDSIGITTLAQRANNKGEQQSVAWLLDRHYEGRAYDWVSPFDAAWDKAREMAETMVLQMRQSMTKHNQQYRTAAQRTSRTVDEATGEIIETIEPMVYRYDDNGQKVAVGPDDRIKHDDVLFDAKGKPIDRGDPRYIDINNTSFAEGGEVMWPLIGPMIEDYVDNLSGANLFMPKQTITLDAGDVVPLSDEVPVWRSTRRDVHAVADGLPKFVAAPRVTDLDQSTWTSSWRSVSIGSSARRSTRSPASRWRSTSSRSATSRPCSCAGR